MPKLERARKAFLLVLPFLIVFYGVHFFMMGIKVYDAKTSYGLFMYLPLIVFGFPWSLVSVPIEEYLKATYPIGVVNQISSIAAFLGCWLNSYVLLGIVAFEKLLMTGVVISILLVMAFASS